MLFAVNIIKEKEANEDDYNIGNHAQTSQNFGQEKKKEKPVADFYFLFFTFHDQNKSSRIRVKNQCN